MKSGQKYPFMMHSRTGEMVQGLRALTALAQDLDLVLRTT